MTRDAEVKQATEQASAEPLDSFVQRSRLLGRLATYRLKPWPYFGGLALAGLALQALTGLLMAFTYQPTPDRAYVSVYYISNVMSYGWLLRTIHVWGAELTIVFAAAHGIHSIWKRSFEGREKAWFLGILAFLSTVALGFTGNLLPWDQRAYWSTATAIELIRRLPLIGDGLASAMLGGAAIGEATLTRFSTAHMMLLPAAVTLLLVAHMRLSSRPAESSSPAEDERVPLYPALLVSAATTFVLLLSVYAVLAILLPASLDVKADPSVALEGVKPTWYLLSMHALSRHLPAALAAALPVTLGVLLALVPLWGRVRGATEVDERWPVVLGLAVAAGLIALTLWGVYV